MSETFEKRQVNRGVLPESRKVARTLPKVNRILLKFALRDEPERQWIKLFGPMDASGLQQAADRAMNELQQMEAQYGPLDYEICEIEL